MPTPLTMTMPLDSTDPTSPTWKQYMKDTLAWEKRMKDNRANISELEQEIAELEEALAVARELRRELFAQEDKAQRYKAVAKVLVETLNEGAWLMPSGMGLNVTALESRKVITEALEEYLKG